MPRTGDEIDDYCTRCHRLTNHTVAAMVGDHVASTTCRTCGFQHEFKGGHEPARPAKSKASAFDQVLAGILGEQNAGTPEPVKPGGGARSRTSKTPSKSPARARSTRPKSS